MPRLSNLVVPSPLPAQPQILVDCNAPAHQRPSVLVSGIAGDAAVRSDKDSSQALTKTWNAHELKEDVEAQAQIMETFGKQAANAIGSYVGKRKEELERRADAAQAAGDQPLAQELKAEAAKWEEGGTTHLALHAAAGALGGGLAGAAGAVTSAAAMSHLAKAFEGMDAPKAVKDALAQVVAGTLGAAVGGMQGMASAVTAEVSNHQLHDKEREWSREQAEEFAEHYREKTGQAISRDRAEQMLLAIGYRMVDAAASKGPGPAGPAGDAVAVSFIAMKAGSLFKATAAERNDPGPLGGPLTPEQKALPMAEGNPVLGAAAAITGGLVYGGVAVKFGSDLWTAYKAASAMYSTGTALGAGVGGGAGLYILETGVSARFRNGKKGNPFFQEFSNNFSYTELATSMAFGGVSGMYNTAMFRWAGIPNGFGNIKTMPGAIIRINSFAVSKAGNSAVNAVTEKYQPEKGDHE